MKTVVFVCKGELRFFYPKIAAALAARAGWRVSAVAFNSLSAAELRASGVFHHVYSVPDALRAAEGRRTGAEAAAVLRDIERETRVAMNTLLFSDRILTTYNHDRALRLMAGAVEFWRDLLAESPDAIFGEISTAVEWMGVVMARARGIRYLMPYIAPAPGRFFLIDSADGLWERMRPVYNRMRQSGLSTAERELANAYLANVRRTREKPEFMQWSVKSPFSTLAPARLAARVGRVPFRVRSWMTDGIYEVGSFHGTNPMLSAAADVTRMARHALAERTYFNHVIDGGDMVYFPLHTQPEYTIDVRSPFLTNQLAVIENIARSVPAGMYVAVKDHPEMQGRRPLGFLAALRAIQNVRLFSPAVDSHALIAASRATVTITGTAAWESRVYGKPAVVLGRVPYGFVDGIRNCASATDLPHAISDAVSAGAPDDEEVRCMVAALLTSAYHGSFDDPMRRPAIIEPGNVTAIAEGVQAEIEMEEPVALSGLTG